MHKLYMLILVAIASFITATLPMTANAMSHDVVISQVQVGNSSSSRLVELFNTSSEPIDITNWCVYHSSASDKSKDKLACFNDTNPQTHILLNGLSYVLIGSDKLGIESDLQMIGGLGGVTGGHVYIQDADGVERDRVGWGTAEKPEGRATGFGIDNTEHVLQRRVSDMSVYVDTDDNSIDFTDATLRDVYQIGSLGEIDDVCSNLDGIQPLLPDGYYRDEVGLCQLIPIDVCLNIDDIQVEAPMGYVISDMGQCTKQDLCLNFDGVQQIVPDGFIEQGDDCILAGLPLQITEVLPNIKGNDEGREFIEIYNPNDTAVDLGFLNIIIGTDLQKIYEFPIGASAMPSGYTVFYNNQIPFTLSNTLSEVSLGVIGGTEPMSISQYVDPKNDMAWAVIDGTWQYTNQQTPGSVNVASVVVVKQIPASNLQPCATNQYRNPETNRCRKIPTEPALTPCGDGEYRSPETNRCRAVLGASTTTLAPCAENQVRNPDTNRCKTVVKMTNAPYPVQTTQVNSGDGYIGWWVAGGVGVLALSYGAWEWRDEAKRLFRWTSNHLQFKK